MEDFVIVNPVEVLEFFGALVGDDEGIGHEDFLVFWNEHGAVDALGKESDVVF